ncbi:MAG: endonuclease/exonuclease/phosphatase family protein [Rectinemataceae bacterium]
MRNARAITLVVLAVFVLCGARCTLPGSGRGDDSLLVISYNAHNLFDDIDTGREYPEFDMDSGKWSSAAYRRRLDALHEAVSSLVPEGGAGPDILCLEEIESGKVLEDLAEGPFRKSGYRSVAWGGPDESPIRCGILSRLPLLWTRCHSVTDTWGFGRGRDLLEAAFDRGAGDPLIVFVCHWKSRKEGPEKTEEARRQAGALLSGRISEILDSNPEALIVVCGDFNESPDEFERRGGMYPTAFMPESEFGRGPEGALYLTGVQKNAGIPEGVPLLYSPWFGAEGYSYRFDGEMERLDGFLLSPGLCDGKGLDFAGFSVADAVFLFDPEGNPMGWNGVSGYSDHLPIALRLSG